MVFKFTFYIPLNKHAICVQSLDLFQIFDNIPRRQKTVNVLHSVKSSTACTKYKSLIYFTDEQPNILIIHYLNFTKRMCLLSVREK